MIRAYDLSSMTETVNALLNDPQLQLISMEISCSKETAYTVANLRFALCKELRETRFNRYIERFLLIDRNGNPELDKKMEDPHFRLIKQYVFPTTEGTVVVIDYQVRKGRTVGANGTI